MVSKSSDFHAADGLCNVAASAWASNGNKGRNATDTSHGDSYDDDDIIGVAVDLDNGAIYFSKNGTWQNSSDPESGASKTGAAYTDILTILPDGGYMFAFNFVYNNSQQEIIQANFGNPILVYQVVTQMVMDMVLLNMQCLVVIMHYALKT